MQRLEAEVVSTHAADLTRSRHGLCCKRSRPANVSMHAVRPVPDVRPLMAVDLLEFPDVKHDAAGRTVDSLGLEIQRQILTIQNLVDTVFLSWMGTRPLIPTRRAHRVPSRQELALTKLDDRSLEPVGETTRVYAWDLSSRGLSFVHQSPLACRNVTITIPLPEGGMQSVQTRLTWCRFTRNRHYRSGGQFVRAISTPADAQGDFDSLREG